MKNLEFGKFIGLEFFTDKDQPDNMLRKKSKRAKIQNFVAVIINKF